MTGSGTIIYVAGNPSLYPLEYYDSSARDFQGVIPDLLREFARESGYDLRYYEPGGEDRREDFAEHGQVDLISGCVRGERYGHTEQEPLILFQAETDSGSTVYQLLFADIAPEQFQSQLRSFFAERTQAEWTGAVLEASSAPPAGAGGVPAAAVAGLGLAACLAAAVLLAAAGRLRRRVRRAEKAALTDPETGVGTQACLEKRFPQVARAANRALYYLIYFQFDLGHMERLAGYEGSLAFRRHGAGLLREQTGRSDVLAQAMGGDLVVLKLAESQAAAEDWTRAALRRIRAFSVAGGAMRQSDAVAGICPLASMEGELHLLLFHARQCALGARREGADYRVCGGAQCELCREERQLLAEIDRGVRRKEFQLYLQLLVDADRRPVGGEALSRWQHPEKGLLNPDRFVPLLEREGRLEQLDFYNLEQVCAFLDRLYAAGIRNFFVSCNFARSTVALEDFVERCERVVGEYRFPRQMLAFEITESEAICAAQCGRMRKNIRAVREMGIHVIFDDFGTGYSSFGDLEEYPMDGLKLDKHLVDNMWTEQGKIILQALVRTGHELGLVILAEGVEDERQADALRQLNCDAFQGFLFSLPLPAPQAEKQILEQLGHRE